MYLFNLYYFCSFKYRPLVNWIITNCALKSISAQSKRLNNCFLLLDCMFVSRATQRPWLCATVFLLLHALSQRVRLYGDIPETHRKEKGSFFGRVDGPQDTSQCHRCLSFFNLEAFCSYVVYFKGGIYMEFQACMRVAPTPYSYHAYCFTHTHT